MLKAWGDESLSDRRNDPGRYIFAAVITDAKTESNAREHKKTLLLPGQKKTHWRDESDNRRDKVIEVLIGAGLKGIIVTRVGPIEERDERRRRKCFEYFARLLSEYEISDLVLESRGRTGDALDIAMANALRAAKYVPQTFRVSHAPGSSEPLLWAADAVCGAYVSERTGSPKWMGIIERNIPIHLVGLPQ